MNAVQILKCRQFEGQLMNFFSWRKLYYEMKCSTDNLRGENHYPFTWFVVSCFEYTFVRHNVIVADAS